MKIDNTNSLTFNSTKSPKYLTEQMRSSLNSILIRMNAETKRFTEGDYFKSKITTELHYKNAVFEDERRLKTKTDHKSQMQGFSNLKIGKKIVLDIDNKTGEIIECIKPFYKPMFLVLRQVEKVLSGMRENFYDSTLVKKVVKTLQELTSEGKSKMEQTVLKIEKQRLENVVKELEERTCRG